MPFMLRHVQRRTIPHPPALTIPPTKNEGVAIFVATAQGERRTQE
jgi:hypothetical protein